MIDEALETISPRLLASHKNTLWFVLGVRGLLYHWLSQLHAVYAFTAAFEKGRKRAAACCLAPSVIRYSVTLRHQLLT